VSRYSDTMDEFERGVKNAARGLHERLANANPKLSRGLVWCHACGRCESVKAAECLRTGWPKCCGATMSLDAPGVA
jgi:hypothetical protein